MQIFSSRKNKVMSLKIFDQYILTKLISIFAFGVVIFSCVLMVSDAFLDLIRYVVNFGVPVKIAVAIVILRIPSVVVLTIPLGVLLATLLVFYQLNNNEEITVMRACGVSLVRIILPVLMFGLFGGAASFLLNEYVVPITNKHSTKLKTIAFSQMNIPLGKQSFTYKDIDDENNLKRLLYIDSYSDKTAEGITLFDFTQDDILQILVAESGKQFLNTWNFYKGSIYSMSHDGKITNSSSFNDFTLALYKNNRKDQEGVKYEDLSISELENILEKVSPEDSSSRNKLLIKIQEKLAIPLTCVCVALISVPISLTPPRSKINWGFFFSVFIIFGYYLLRSFTIPLGLNGTLSPFLAAWLPNICMASLGLYLLLRKNR